MAQNANLPQFTQRRLREAALSQRVLDMTIIGTGVIWLVLIQLRWMVQGEAPTALDIFVGAAFLAIGGALWLNHRSRASFMYLTHSESLRHQLEDVVSSMSGLMIVMSPDGLIQRVNKTALSMLGYIQADMIGQSINQFMVQGGAPFSTMRALYEGKSVSVTRSFRTRAGRLLPMSVTYTAITATDGTLQGMLCVAQDLGEVESIRAQLQTTNQRYNAAITSSRLGVYEYDPHTNHLAVDNNFKQLLAGRGDANINVLDDAMSYFLIEDHPKIYTALNHLLSGKIAHIDLEIRANSPIYGLRWLQVRGAINEMDGRLFGTLMDITARKSAEDALDSRDAITNVVARASGTFMHSLEWRSHLDNLLADLGVAVNVSRVYVFRKHMAADGQTVLMSQEAEWCAKEIDPQQDNPELQNVDMKQAGFERWLKVLSATDPLYGTLDSFPPLEQAFLGRQGILSLLVAPIFVNDEWWGHIGFDDCRLPRVWVPSTISALRLVADILGAAIFRAEAYQKIESDREFVENIMSNLGQGVTMISGESKLLYVNPAYAQMLGLNPDDLIGRSPAEFTEPEDLATLQYNRKLRAQGQVSSYSTHLRHKDGYTTEVLITGVPRWVDGKVDGAYCVVADISERRKLETQRFELLLEKARVRLMSDFMRDISHEFRTPLSIIQTSLYLLKRKPDHPQAAARLDVIGGQATRLNRLVDELMLMLELEQAEIVARLISLNTLAVHVIEKISKKAEEKALLLTLEEPDGSVSVQGEEGYLMRAIAMLVDNAVEFTSDGGSVNVTVRAEPNYAVVSVKDTGVGIPPDELENIFDHMYKVDKARNTERGGLGLGLSIVRRISALHRGEITVESELGKGSTFTLRLPYSDQSKPTMHPDVTQEISAVAITSTDEVGRATT